MSKAKSKKSDKKTLGKFTLKKENATILKSIIETLAGIVEEAKFHITPKGLTILAADDSMVCLLELKMVPGDFDDFNCSGDNSMMLNLDNLDKIMKRSSANDTIELNYIEEEQKIKVKMIREEQKRVRTFSLALLDSEERELSMGNLEKIEYDTTWEMKPDFLLEAVKDAEIYSDIFNIKTDSKKGLTFSSNGTIGEMEYFLELDELINSKIEGEHLGAFSITFLKKFLKIASITLKLDISILTDYPLKMIIEILEGGVLRYFLAPRIEKEDDFEDDNEGFLEETDPVMEEIIENQNSEESEE